MEFAAWVCMLGSFMRHCWCLFLCMVMRQWYGGSVRDIGWGLYRWTSSEVRWVSGKRIKPQMHRKKQFCKVTKDVDKNFYEGICHWFGHEKRKGNDRIAKSVYLDECADSCSKGRPRKRWIDFMKGYLKKRGLVVSQT